MDRTTKDYIEEVKKFLDIVESHRQNKVLSQSKLFCSFANEIKNISKWHRWFGSKLQYFKKKSLPQVEDVDNLNDEDENWFEKTVNVCVTRKKKGKRKRN